MPPSQKIAGLLTVLSLATSSLAQDPPIQTSDTFVLYPYVTSGELSGPYTNSDLARYSLRPTSGRQADSYETDCFNRMILTNYLPTHCYNWQDQCGGTRWSLNETYPSLGEHGLSIAAYASGLSSMLIASPTETDDQGRRQLGWTSSVEGCGNEPKTPGFSIESNPDVENGILHLVYDNQEDENASFGTFYTCWVEGDVYGPRVFYRHAEEGPTPEGCVEVFLVPRCVNEPSLVQRPVGSRCYLGGLPA